MRTEIEDELYEDAKAEARKEMEDEGFQTCDVCEARTPEDEGEWVDLEDDDGFVCNDCLDEAEDAKAERQLEAREWAGYDKWEARAHGGVDEYGM